MIEVIAPSSIGVEIPTLTSRGELPIAVYTQLFRADCDLPTALGEAYVRHLGASTLSIISAACSIGAEVDSILALHQAAGQNSSLTVNGFDINDEAIRVARSGQYLIPRLLQSDEGLEDMRETLERYGFVTDFETIYHGGSLRNIMSGADGYHLADANRLRQEHNVTFEVRDLIEARTTGPKADLVLCNNLLYHLQPEPANAVLRNLAAMVKEEGVLSMKGSKKERMMGVRRRIGGMTYGAWLEEAIDFMGNEFGIEPILESPEEVPMLFARN
jgi:chemotaxis methyl-accepting protein methylase